MSSEQKQPAELKSLRVEATQVGFYKGQRIREGVTFTLLRAEDFSAKWMKPVDESVADQLAARTVPKKRVEVPAPRTTRADRADRGKPRAAAGKPSKGEDKGEPGKGGERASDASVV